MAASDLDNGSVANTLNASTLTSIATGTAAAEVGSAQTSAEAADVTILTG